MQQLLSALSDNRKRDAVVRKSELRADIEGLLGKFFPETKSSATISNVCDYLFNDAQLNVGGATDLENVYLAHIQEIKRYVMAHEQPPSGVQILETGEGEDCIVPTIEKWDGLKLINYILLQSIPTFNKRAIVATVRDEGLSILEWIAYYRVIGFDEFFIYTNDNTDGSLELLEALAHHNLITLIKNSVSAKVSPQQKCYEHSLFLLPQLRAFQWVSYLDVDEFLLLKGEGLSMQALSNQVEALNIGESFSSVFYNWKWFGSGHRFDMEDGFVLERFNEARSDTHGKSVSRLRDIVSMRPVHYPTLLPGCQLLDSDLKPIADITKHEPVYEKGQVNHYWNKSFEEFALKKARGLSSQGTAGRQRDFEQFFAWDARAGNAAIEEVPAQLIGKVRAEYENLVRLPGIGEQLTKVRSAVQAKLAKLNERYDLRNVFAKNGAI